MIIIRAARPEDLPALTGIYNHAVIHTTATFDLEPQSLEERKRWMESHGPLHPLLVAEEDGNVLGYCGILPYRTKPAYSRTVEISVYVHPEARRRGVAGRLMEAMIQLARSLKHHVIIAGITGGNEASFRLHRKYGFREVGVLKEVGFKFGAWQDVHFFQLML
ncbi:GNAT family N-acetyltransferase [Staphylospora marina]|uniref:GNAT family N-acetyltransferase n=1 Tax=Staphylospora marina TaxID=2490858 RepID=UPI000F5BF800|nr:GNAT family N-acetyltransferase [Staphylospora marina]